MASAASDSDLAATTCSCRTAESLSCYCQVGSAPSVREAQQYDERTECEHVDSKSLDLSTYPHAHLLGPALRRRSRPARLASSRAPARRTTHSVARRGARSAGRTTATADTGRGLGPTAIFQKRKKPSSLLKKPSSLTWREGKRQRLFRWGTLSSAPCAPCAACAHCGHGWRRRLPELLETERQARHRPPQILLQSQLHERWRVAWPHQAPTASSCVTCGAWCRRDGAGRGSNYPAINFGGWKAEGGRGHVRFSVPQRSPADGLPSPVCTC